MSVLNNHPLVIAMILFPDLTQLDLAGPYEVFAQQSTSAAFITAVCTARQQIQSRRRVIAQRVVQQTNIVVE